MQNKNNKSLFGVDINEYTKNVNFAILTTKIDFLYLRSSGSGSGRFRIDRKFLEYANNARNYGIPVGAFHYALPSSDLSTADSQCDDFIEILQIGFGQKDYGDLFPTLDVEAPVEKTISTKVLVEWIERFKNRFEKKTRRKLMLYTGAFFIDLYDNFFVQGRGYPLKSMPLWIAMYTNIPGNPPYPKNQGGWTRWRIWQFSENLRIQGIDSLVDANWGPDNLSLLTQPENVTGFNVNNVEGNKINLTWNKVKSSDLLGYNIFVNNYYVATLEPNDTSYTLNRSNFSAKTLNITIEAFDKDGETSKTRAKVTI